MSRIIVKQLPKNINEEKLRSLFGSKGTITDMQLKYTPDGKFRQFCFIGYRNENDAQEAIKFFNNSCIQTNRIKVELCAALGSDDKPNARSKYAKKSETNENLVQNIATKETEPSKKVSKVDEIIGKHKDDPDFQEFLKAHDKKRALWSNDAGDVSEALNHKAADEVSVDRQPLNVKGNLEESGEESDEIANVEPQVSNAKEKIAEKSISDLEYMKSLMVKSTEQNEKGTSKSSSKKSKDTLDLFTIKVHNVPYNTKRQEILKFFKPLRPYSVRLPAKVHGFCYVGFKTEKEMTKAMQKNKSFIKGKQVFFSDFTEKNKITKSKNLTTDNTGSSVSTNAKWTQQEENVRNEEGIAESGHIFFRNLAYTVTEDDLQKLFEKFGPIADISLPVDALTRQIKGFGTVTFLMPEHALMAFNKLDGTDFHGRLLHLIPGKIKEKDVDEDENDVGLNFKQKKALKQKKSAQHSINWNTLFLGANAVAEIIAKKFGITKEKVLDTSEGSSSAAVRIALGETQIVIEMKQFLEENGVRLSVFDGPVMKRSKTIILVKNLPAETTIEDLTPIFSKFGPIGRLILPPSGVTALIEYCDPSEARQAFKKLAYSKFKHLPLYLEWAPENTFTKTLSGEPIIPKQENSAIEVTSVNIEAGIMNEKKEELVDAKQNNNIDADKNVALDEESDHEQPELNTTLFLRNLNFKTVSETVRNHFKHLGAIHTVEIAKRKDAQNPKKFTSLGYGFIQFKKSISAEKALKQMQFTEIDGNKVELKRSDRTLKTTVNAQRRRVNATKQTGSKILVRNIPFQAKVKEVRELFKAFGEIRSVRLPMKMTPGADTHRGFGFVDFVTKSDAKRAFDTLSQSTHLYGRRLVLEWASIDEDNVDELRKRTAQQYYGTENNAKRSKKAVFNAEESVADGVDDAAGF